MRWIGNTRKLNLPVRHRAVIPPQAGVFPVLVRVILCRLEVEFDANSRNVGGNEVPGHDAALRGEDVRHRGWDHREFLNAEIGDAHVELDAGRGVHGAQRIVQGRVDVVHFAHGGDLLALGDAAHEAQVRPRIVNPLVLDKLPELPLGEQLFAGGDGSAGVMAQVGERLRILRANGVFDEERAQRLKVVYITVSPRSD